MPTTVSSQNDLVAAVENAGPGSEIVVSGGTYRFDGEWNIRSSGEAGNPLVIRAADGTRPQIQFSAGLENPTSDSGVKVDGNHVTIDGFEITDSGYKGIYASQADGCTFENLDVHHCNVWGIMNNGSDDVTFRNCDSHHNFDPQNNGQNSDGINMTGPAKNGLIEGCRAWENGDDGYDMWVSENHTIRNCWAWNNGAGGTGNGNGFKLGATPKEGGGGHLVYNCVSFGNKVQNDSNSPGSGFWWNGEDQNEIEVYNCTAWDNGVNFAFADTNHVLKNNLSFNGPDDVRGPVVEEANSWNLDISDPDFRSLDSSSDDFLRLAESSQARNAGVAVGLNIGGSTPDLGAFQYEGGDASGSSSSTPAVTVDGATTLGAGAAAITSTKLQSNHSGYNGAGFLNFIADEGAMATWPLDVAAPGTYNYKIRYASGVAEDRDATLLVDDASTTVTFARTDGWSNWRTLTGTLDLPAGATELTIQTTGQDGGNIDQITLEPVEVDFQNEGNTSGTALHGYHVPEPGQADWHVPLNENFAAIDRDVPVVDAEGAKENYPPADGTLFIARDTGAMYVGDGSQWQHLGTL